MTTAADSSGDTPATISGLRRLAESERPAEPGTTLPPMLSREETARRGKEIYQRDVRPQVEAEHHGEYVAIDVGSGGWAMADDLLSAAESLRAQHPGAVDVWAERVGHPTLRKFGGRALRPAR